MAFLTQKERSAIEDRQRLERLVEDEQWCAKLRRVFATADGMDVLDWILDKAGVLDSIMTGNSQTYYLAGKQDLGQSLLTEIMRADRTIFHALVDRWGKGIDDKRSAEMREIRERMGK